MSDNLTTRCAMCGHMLGQGDKEHKRYQGYEIGIAKWFKTIEPWRFQKIVCRKCFKTLFRMLGAPEAEMANIDRQEPTKK